MKIGQLSAAPMNSEPVVTTFDAVLPMTRPPNPAMIGAIVLTHRRRADARGQKVGKQIDRRPEDSVRMANPPVGEGVKL